MLNAQQGRQSVSNIARVCWSSTVGENRVSPLWLLHRLNVLLKVLPPIYWRVLHFGFDFEMTYSEVLYLSAQRSAQTFAIVMSVSQC